MFFLTFIKLIVWSCQFVTSVAVIFDNDNAFKQPLIQTTGTASIQYKFPTMGLYALEVVLQNDGTQADTLEVSQNSTQRFLFLVGFPIIKILVFVALGFLLLLGFTLLKQLEEGAK